MFRATILFKNFKPEGPADRVIVYLTVFIQKCLQEIQRKNDSTLQQAQTIVNELVKEAVPTCADSKFFMKQLGLIVAPKGAAEEDKLRKYLS